VDLRVLKEITIVKLELCAESNLLFHMTECHRTDSNGCALGQRKLLPIAAGRRLKGKGKWRACAETAGRCFHLVMRSYCSIYLDFWREQV
jgi:hypothetical protein